MSDNEGKARDLIAEAEKKLTAKPMFGRNTIIHFLPLFGCLGDSAWNCIPTVYSVARGSSYFLQPRLFSHIVGRKVLLYTDPPSFRGVEVIQGQLLIVTDDFTSLSHV